MANKLKWKVCGMRELANIQDVLSLKPDYMGFIFYPKSSRYVVGKIDPAKVRALKEVQKVGVFVNEEKLKIKNAIDAYGLQAVQLHGTESPSFCNQIRQLNVTVIKVFSVGENFDFNQLQVFEDVCDYFLFDTKGKLPGGNGYTFNWQVLKEYPSKKAFFLSGGISLENIHEFQKLKSLPIHSIDINSRFEISPGFKDVESIQKLTKQLNFVLQ